MTGVTSPAKMPRPRANTARVALAGLHERAPAGEQAVRRVGQVQDAVRRKLFVCLHLGTVRRAQSQRRTDEPAEKPEHARRGCCDSNRLLSEGAQWSHARADVNAPNAIAGPVGRPSHCAAGASRCLAPQLWTRDASRVAGSRCVDARQRWQERPQRWQARPSLRAIDRILVPAVLHAGSMDRTT